MKQAPCEISESAFRAFIRTWGLFRNRMDPYFAQFGLSGARWGVLRNLRRVEDQGLLGLRLTELGHRLLVKPPSITGVIRQLERKGLVACAAAPTDQRAKLVTLTPAGRQLVDRILQQHPRQIQSIMGGLNETEQRELHRLMERLAAHLESLDGQTHGQSGGRRARLNKPEGVN